MLVLGADRLAPFEVDAAAEVPFFYFLEELHFLLDVVEHHLVDERPGFVDRELLQDESVDRPPPLPALFDRLQLEGALNKLLLALSLRLLIQKLELGSAEEFLIVLQEGKEALLVAAADPVESQLALAGLAGALEGFFEEAEHPAPRPQPVEHHYQRSPLPPERDRLVPADVLEKGEHGFFGRVCIF